ncbi:transglycosylase family protein [Kitasatospora griseola]|uniref:transglycosylase family protein n=1 Tax=Kitasatospora griseola TaxID=2064 RepID=UPI00381C6A07
MTTTTRKHSARALTAAALLALAAPLLADGQAQAASVATWDKVAQCESSGNWSINTGNGLYGGLQFKQSTWVAYGGTQYAARADLATKQQQILIAEKVLRAAGPGQWGCATTAGLTNDGIDPYPADPSPTVPAVANFGSGGRVATGVHADGRVEVFAVTPGGGISNRAETSPGGAWSSWNGFGPAGTVTSVATARHADGRLEVFASLSDGSVVNEAETSPGGAWSGWYGFAPAGTAKSITTGVHADGRVEVFAVTPGGGMTNRAETAANGAWSGWNGFGPAGTVTNAATARHADGRLEVFTVMNDGSVMNEAETAANGAWSSWNAFATYGTAKGDGSPGALTTGVHADGRVEVFAVTPTGGMTNRAETSPGGAWSKWNGFGPAGTVTAAATARHADGRLEVFTVMDDGSVMNEAETAANGAWSAWNAFALNGTAKP